MRILIYFFSFFLLTACTGEYWDHIKREHADIVSASGSIWSVSGVLYSLPDKKVLEDLIRTLAGAKSRIWLETYTWTEKETLEAIIQAKKRWVDVRVVLEGNVYRTPWINNSSIKQLQDAGIDFSYADNHRYTFTHIKTWVIDDRWCISTGNWSFTSFTKNREFIYCSFDVSLLHDIEEIIQSDFKHERPYFPDGLDSRIGLSPENIRPWLISHIQKAKNDIIVYNQSITDQEILTLLKEKADRWIIVKLCQADHEDEESKTGELIFPKNIEIKTSKKPYLHAKVFLIDGAKVILWSANMTQNALENNREILINLGENKEFYETIFSFYDKDCYSSSGK